jgi:hypothetical protein
LYFALVEQGRSQQVVTPERIAFCVQNPPSNTRAQARGMAVRHLRDQSGSYIINWDSIAVESKDPLIMNNPFHPYQSEVAQLLFSDRDGRTPPLQP